MKQHFALRSVLLALATGLALTACDRREDLPTAATDPASAVPGTMPSDTAGTMGTSPTTSPDGTIQQNPTAAGGIYSPGSNAGTTGSTTDAMRGDSPNAVTPGNPNIDGAPGSTSGSTGSTGTMGDTGTSGSGTGTGSTGTTGGSR